VPYQLLDQTTTPDGEPLELAIERGSYVLRVGGRLLMSSACHGSERAMASVAAELLGEIDDARVLVGGLGMGHTLRAALDVFGRRAKITVAELLPAVILYNQGVLGPLAGHPLRDRRVTLFEGDVRVALEQGPWDAILLDVDNGPDAMVVGDNAALYGDGGSARLAATLRPGGVAIVWAGYPSRAYERTLRAAGLEVETRRVRARWPLAKGAKHVLFVGRRPPEGS
jgi:spermidine synthase